MFAAAMRRGSMGIPGNTTQQAPSPSQKKEGKKKFEFILQALLKDNKNVRKGPSETKQRKPVTCFYSLVLQLKSQ